MTDVTKPIRVQLSRRKGYRLADAAGNGLPTVKVDRTTMWGNQFRVYASHSDGDLTVSLVTDERAAKPPAGFAAATGEAPALAVLKYRHWLTTDGGILMRQLARRELAGKNLGCWCPLPAPGEPDHCHAAVLLEIANAPEEP